MADHGDTFKEHEPQTCVERQAPSFKTLVCPLRFQIPISDGIAPAIYVDLYFQINILLCFYRVPTQKSVCRPLFAWLKMPNQNVVYRPLLAWIVLSIRFQLNVCKAVTDINSTMSCHLNHEGVGQLAKCNDMKLLIAHYLILTRMKWFSRPDTESIDGVIITWVWW